MTEVIGNRIIEKSMTKTELAEKMGVSRQALYYQHKQPEKDLLTKTEIEKVLKIHTSYGHKRIAIELKINKKRVRRVMKIFNIKPHKRRIKHPVKPEDLNKIPTIYQNEIKFLCPIRPNVVWAADFTYIKFHGKFIYLATIIDVFTREIIGWAVSSTHDRFMVIEAYEMAKVRTGTVPIYCHSDQGSEYDSHDYTIKLKNDKVIVSMSEKGHPWENGFQESFYSNFKLDLGWPNQYETLPELIEAIHLQIHYYNTERIHTKIKTQPATFKAQYYIKMLTINDSPRRRILV
jgi:transposase InsO family protein